MDILVTGAEGFVGKNLVLRLRESPHFIISTYSRGDSFETLKKSFFPSSTSKPQLLQFPNNIIRHFPPFPECYREFYAALCQ